MSQICPNCGHMGWPVKKTKGSAGMEIILWLCFLLPGLLYSHWRGTNRPEVCPKCDATDMIPIDSPRAKKLIKDFGISDEAVQAVSQSGSRTKQAIWQYTTLTNNSSG
mgnify:CR=1 FL=1